MCAAVKEALREVLDQWWACVRSRGRDARACSRSLKKKGDDREDADPECRADHDPQADAPDSRERISRSRDDSRMGVFARHLWLPSMNTTAYARSCQSIKRHLKRVRERDAPAESPGETWRASHRRADGKERHIAAPGTALRHPDGKPKSPRGDPLDNASECGSRMRSSTSSSQKHREGRERPIRAMGSRGASVHSVAHETPPSGSLRPHSLLVSVDWSIPRGLGGGRSEGPCA